MSLSVKSPVINLKDKKSINEFKKKIDIYGHVVLKNTFTKKFLSNLENISSNFYDDVDKIYNSKNQKFKKSEIDTYLGSHFSFESVFKHQKKNEISDEFYDRILNSNFKYFLSKYFNGSFFVGDSEHCIRRASSGLFYRLTGLHRDDQFDKLSKYAKRAKNMSLTVWTPLSNCTDKKTPRLLLLDQKHSQTEIEKLLEENENVNLKKNNLGNFFVFIKPYQIKEELDLNLIRKLTFKKFKKIYESKKCFAPYIPLGSSIVFKNNVLHGSFITKEMKNVRYSMDFRVCGDFPVNNETKYFKGKKFVKKNGQCLIQSLEPKVKITFTYLVRKFYYEYLLRLSRLTLSRFKVLLKSILLLDKESTKKIINRIKNF